MIRSSDLAYHRNRRPRVDSQDRELFWLGCTTQSTNLVRDFHSVRYPVCRTTDNRSWSVSLQWYSCLTLNGENLVGFRRDSYCAYWYRGQNQFFRVTYRLSNIQARCHIIISFKKETHFIKWWVEYVGNIIIIIWFFVCWHEYFATWFYIQTIYCIYI